MKTTLETLAVKSQRGARRSRTCPRLGAAPRWVLALWCGLLLLATARAGVVVNNNDGYFLDDYASSAGLQSAIQVRVASGGAVSLISPNT